MGDGEKQEQAAKQDQGSDTQKQLERAKAEKEALAKKTAKVKEELDAIKRHENEVDQLNEAEQEKRKAAEELRKTEENLQQAKEKHAEEEKLRLLTEQITAVFGNRPTTYLAGRYGFGPNTGHILEAQGYEVDISPAVPKDYSAQNGPDFSDYTSDPYWFGASRRLLGLPSSGGYVGLLRSGGTPLYRRITHPVIRRLHISGAIARLRLLELIRLSPEDYSEPEMRRLTRTLMGDGVRVFVFTFHSPSVMPGGSPYVHTSADLERFLEKCRGFFQFFLEELGGLTMTPLEVKKWLERLSDAPSPQARREDVRSTEVSPED